LAEHSETRILPYSADLMYAVVADVERYPEFLPWCVGLRVLSRAQDGARQTMMAEMMVGYHGLRERYTSRVVLDPAMRSIDVEQSKGPFRRLENHWRFAPMPNGCRVDFRIAFEFKSRILNAVAGAAFERVLFKMADAFEKRAKALSQQSLQQQ
jgi:coenzyme Q-binding protein COQ10